MAICANLVACDMVGRFRRRLDGADRGVAAYTGGVRSLELAAGMAALAGDVGMRPVKLETGAEVIEGLVGESRCRQQDQEKQRR